MQFIQVLTAILHI